MTTVAWDGKTVAADSLITYSNGSCVPGERANKIRELPGGRLFAGAGNTLEINMAYDWLAGGMKDPKPPVTDFCALIVSRNGATWINEKLYPHVLTSRYFAIGSGEDYASTAMELGKTAAQAVAVAMKFDRNTGGQIKTAAPNDKPKRKRKCQEHRTHGASKARIARSKRSAKSAQSSARRSRC